MIMFNQEITNNDDDFGSDIDEQELADIENKLNQNGHHGGELTFSLECDKLLLTEGTPQQRYRPRYLIVSDFVSQQWCEQQLLYNLDPDIYLLRYPSDVKVTLEETAAVKEVKKKGSDIHQGKELEIQIPVEVTVITKEDQWAVKFLNLQSAVLAFHGGSQLAREIPVFGVPFGCDLFLFGIIDELQYDPNTHTIKILELKTRQTQYLPKKSQQRKDQYQVGLYAQMFNELVQGQISKEILTSYLKLNLDQPLSDEVMMHIGNINSKCKKKIYTLGNLLDVILSQIQSLTCITEAIVQYVHQDSKTEIASNHLILDPELVQLEFTKQCQWWRGERGTTGVEIEDCWKCDYCQFSDLCEWREVMAAKSIKNVKR